MAKPKLSGIMRNSNVDVVEPKGDSINQVALDEHINNKDIHVDDNLRDYINYIKQDIEKHVSREDVHVSLSEKNKWNNKETPEGAQSKANKVLNSLDQHKIDRDVHITKKEKELFKDKYTKAETRNLIKYGMTGLKFLPAVNYRHELETKYPNPELNSCVYVRDVRLDWIYNGTEWCVSNIVFTPDVTEEYDGLMSMSDKKKLDSIEDNANYYVHPDDVDTKHVSNAEKDYWNRKADNIKATPFNDGLIGSADFIRLMEMEDKANNYIHPETHDPSIINQDENNRFVTDKQINSWDNKPEKEYVDKVSSNVLSTAKSFAESKIAGMFNAAENQLQVLRSLSFELKKDEIVKKFFDLFNSCAKNEEFQSHVLNDKVHMNRNDISLLQNVKSLLEKGMSSDWNEKDTTSIRYIENKPNKLPADGGNADTVGNYSAEEIIDKTVDVLDNKIVSSLEELEDVINIYNTAIILKGSYKIDKELVLRVSNKTIKANSMAKLIGASIKIIGNNNTIENIHLTNGDDAIVDRAGIIIEGDDNVIRNVFITNYNKGIVIEGSNNTIIHDKLSNIRKEAIEVVSNINANYGNIIDKNRIKNSNIGVVLNSSEKSLTKNHITRNSILGCNIGIILSNKVNDSTKTILNIISENIVMRGRGEKSDYLPSQKTIISEFSSKNIISSNITSGKEITAPYDVLSNNIS